jgi:hypothetical protein
MSNMHTYNYECDICHSTIDMELNNVIEVDPSCPCGNKMDLIFYLKSSDTRTI